MQPHALGFHQHQTVDQAAMEAVKAEEAFLQEKGGRKDKGKKRTRDKPQPSDDDPDGDGGGDDGNDDP